MSKHDDAIHRAAIRFVEATIRPLADLSYGTRDGVEVHAIADLRSALGLCRECGGNKEHGRGSMLRCICVPVPAKVTVPAPIARPVMPGDNEPDPDYKRDAKRNGDF